MRFKGNEEAPAPRGAGAFALLPFKQTYCGGGVTKNSIPISSAEGIGIPFYRLCAADTNKIAGTQFSFPSSVRI